MSNFGQLKTRVSKRLGLDTTAGEDDDTQVASYLNDAVVDFLLETHCRVAVAESVALTAGAEDYELDTDILAIHTIIDPDRRPPMERVDEAEIHELRRASTTASSAMVYAVSGSNMLMVWPTPQSTTTLTVYYVPRPTAMSDDSDDPATLAYGGIPAEYHKALEAYGCWQAADYDDDMSSQGGIKYQSEYGAWIARFRKNQRLKGGRKMARLRAGRYSRPSSDPSRT